MVKFNRKYLLQVEQRQSQVFISDPEFRDIQLPFTVEFDIQQNSFGSAQNANFRVYNLSKKTRDLLRHDEWSPDLSQTVIFQAGYEDTGLSTVFTGNVFQAWSVREGTDYITNITALDGGFAFVKGSVSQSFQKGTSYQEIVRRAIASMPGISIGKIGSNVNGSIARGNSYNGNPVDIIRQTTEGNLVVYNGKAYVLSDSEATQGQVALISPSTGLLNTPVRQKQYVNVELLFEPRLELFQKVRLESTDASFNGDYKVISLQHRGIISATVSGQAITKVGLAPGDFILV